MEVYFLLKDSKKEATTIRLQARFDGKLFRYATGISLKPKQWSKAKQKIHSGVKNSGGMNKYLENLHNTLKEEYYKLIAEKRIPTIEYFKSFLDDKFKKGKKEAFFILDYLKEYIEFNISRKSKDTIKSYTALLNNLIEFETKKKVRLTYESLTKQFYLKLVDYFAHEKGLLNSTIKENYIKNFNALLNWAVNNEYVPKNPFKGIKFPYKVNPAPTIALNEEELMRLYNLDLSNNERLLWVRDIFCVECFSGLRFSDLKNISPEKIKGNVLEVFTKKTNDALSIPLRPEAIAIINKYHKNNIPFPDKTDQKTNEYLKELGKLAKINEPITSLFISGIKTRQETKPKYEMLSTHTGRRTFVTISYQKGMRALDIMRITGHKDSKSFEKYYRLSTIKVHENFHAAWSTIQPKYGTEQIIKNLLDNKVEKKIVALSFGITLEQLEELVKQ